MKTLSKYIVIIFVILVILSFVGVQPLSAYKDAIIGIVKVFPSEGRDAPPINEGTSVPIPGGLPIDEGRQVVEIEPPPVSEEPTLPPYKPPVLDTIPKKETEKEYVRVVSILSAFDTGELVPDTVDEMNTPCIEVEVKLILAKDAKPGYYDIELISKISGESYGVKSIDWHIGEEFGFFTWDICPGEDRLKMKKGMPAADVFRVVINYRSYNIDNPMLNYSNMMSEVEEELFVQINIIRTRKGLSPLGYSSELQNIARDRTLKRIESDVDLDLPMGGNWRELKYYKQKHITATARSGIVAEIIGEWMSNNDSISLIQSQNARIIGVSISSGKSFFVCALIGVD